MSTESLSISGIPVTWKKTSKGVSVMIHLDTPTTVTISPAPKVTSDLVEIIADMIRQLKK